MANGRGGEDGREAGVVAGFVTVELRLGLGWTGMGSWQT